MIGFPINNKVHIKCPQYNSTKRLSRPNLYSEHHNITVSGEQWNGLKTNSF